MADTIANMLAQISNANHKFKETVDIPVSKLKVEIARVLKEEGYINHYRVGPDRKPDVLRLTLKYSGPKDRVIQGLKRYSRPGLRAFTSYKDIPPVQNGLGTAIISTSRGVMAGRVAKQNKLGGEIICTVW